MPKKVSAADPLCQCSLPFQLDALVGQLQDCLDRIKSNADQLAGEVFHHDELFGDPEHGGLDEKFQELIAELKSLTKVESEG